MTSSDKSPRSPLPLVLAVAAITMGLVVWHLWADYDDMVTHSAEVAQATKTSACAARILHLDEVLTMSARMAAATGDKAWIDRYLQFEPELDNLIKEAESLTPTAKGFGYTSETNKANVELVKMEKASFELVLQDRKDEAWALLTGPEYMRQKDIYAAGMDAFVKEIETQRQNKSASQQRHLLLFQIAQCAIAIALMGLWYFILRRVASRWRSHADQHRALADSLRVSEERYRILFESSQDALMTLAPPSWKFTSGNPAAVELFGTKDAAEMTALGPWELSPERQPDGRPSAEKAKEMIETAMREGSHLFEWTHKRLGGEDFPATVLLTRMELAGQTLLQATVRDVTAQKRTEEQIKSLARFPSENPDPVLRIARNGKVLYANAAATRFLEEPGAVTEAVRRAAQQAFASGKQVTFEVADADRIFSVSSSLPVPDGDYVNLYGRDITDRKRAEEERQKTLHRQQGISLLSQSLLAAGALEGKLKTVTDAIVRLFDADFCRVWLIRPGDFCERGCVHAEVHEGPHVCRYRDRCLHLLASSGRYTHTDGKGHRRVPFGCYKIGRVASGQEHKFLTNDAVNDPRVHNHPWARELGLVAFAGYQLRAPGGETLGVLALFAKHPISPEEDAMLDALSSAVALVAQQAAAETALQQANVRLEELATTDAVTGLANRRRFMEALEAEFRRSRRYGGRLALAMVDVDRFKLFNDAHGHAFGDRVLVEVAKRLATESRQTDVVARLGGDEFVVLMPETSADEAVRAAERIRKTVSKDPISDGERSVPATVSVGIGTVQNGKAGTPESLLKQADDAMYAAKEAGRNRVCLAPSEKAVSPAQ